MSCTTCELEVNEVNSYHLTCLQDEAAPVRGVRQGGIGGDVENTRRAYYKELHKIMESADVILEVLETMIG